MSDNRALAHHAPGGGVAADADSPRREVGIPVEQRMAMLREALINPDVDPQKAVAMAELMFRLEDRDRQAEFNRDLIAAKAEIPPIFKRGKNTHQGTKYAKFEDIQRVVDPILTRHRLSLDFKIGTEGNMITVKPVLRHKNGWVEIGDAIKGPPDEGPGRSKIQSVGSSSSYLQRYAAKAALNLRFDGEDDDGVLPRAGEQVNDRQARLIADAQEQADARGYQEWYSRQTARDKAFLVTCGVHARLGGGQALPGPTVREAALSTPETTLRDEATNPDLAAGAAHSEPLTEDPKPAKVKPQTPAEWVERFEGEVGRFTNVDSLDVYMDGRKEALSKLEASNPALHEQALKAYRDHRAAIEEGRLV